MSFFKLFKPSPGRLASEGDVEGLLRASDSHDPELQTAALYHLGLLLGRWFIFYGSYIRMPYAGRPFNKHSPTVTKHIASILRSGEPRLRIMAATSLSQLSGTLNSDAIDALFSTLDDSLVEVRRSAVASLVFWAIVTVGSGVWLEVEVREPRRELLSELLTSNYILRLLEEKDRWISMQAIDLLAYVENQQKVKQAVNEYLVCEAMDQVAKSVIERRQVVSLDREQAIQKFKTQLDPKGIIHPDHLEPMSRDLLMTYWIYHKARELSQNETLTTIETQFYSSVVRYTSDYFKGRPA